MPISIIAAIAENNCIGVNGELPWHIPEDMKHFRELTSGKTVLMGRRTWESIPEKFRPLPNRTNIVITRQNDYPLPEGVLVYDSINAALDAHKEEEVMIIGGGEIYAAAVQQAHRLYITHVHQNIDACTAYFPEITDADWQKTEQEDYAGYSFVTYERN